MAFLVSDHSFARPIRLLEFGWQERQDCIVLVHTWMAASTIRNISTRSRYCLIMLIIEFGCSAVLDEFDWAFVLFSDPFYCGEDAGECWDCLVAGDIGDLSWEAATIRDVCAVAEGVFIFCWVSGCEDDRDWHIWLLQIEDIRIILKSLI